MEPSEIGEFFNGRSVFITGGTGFIGKAVIEKLLRSCPGVENIFVLIRDKKGSDASARLQSLLAEPLFEALKRECADSLEKVVAVPGDITLPWLGISVSDMERLRKVVSVVIHAAATVRFDEPLEVALEYNLGGTTKLLDLAQTMPSIQAVVYVSTAFSNCERPFIEEKVYPSGIDPRWALNLPKIFSQELLNSMMPQLLGNKPNTYTLTKHLAEEMVNQRKESVPVCVVRPSIVGGALEEPIPGFVDNFNAASGLLAGIMSGVLHTILLNDEFLLDVVPLDFVVNLLLAAACHLGKISNRSGDLQIYNLSSWDNPLMVQKLVPAGFESFNNNPFSSMIWYPFIYFTDSKLLNRIQNFLFHFLPAYLLDAGAGLMGKKKVYMRLYEKFAKNIAITQYFRSNKWKFGVENTKKLYASLPTADKIMFPFDTLNIEWHQYALQLVEGIRIFALKDKGDPKDSQRILSRKKLIHNASKWALFLILFVIIFFGVSFTWNFMNTQLSRAGTVLREL